MTLARRDFIRRTSLALAGGLLVGDAALQMFERLTHSRVFAFALYSPEMTLAELYRQANKDALAGLKMVIPDADWLNANWFNRWPKGVEDVTTTLTTRVLYLRTGV